MANKVEQLKTKLQETKNGFDVLKNTQKENLEQTKIQEKYEEIKQVKKELQELKKDTFEDPNVQSELSQIEKEINALESDFNKEFSIQLATLKSEVKNNQAEKKDEKEKGRLREQRDGVTDKEEWKEHTLRNVGRVAMGVGTAALVYKGIKRLFGRGKEKKSENSEGDNKEKKSRWKKALLRGGGIFGGLTIWNNWDKIKDWFGRGKDKPENGNPNIINSPSSYNRLPEVEKEKYNSVSDEIDGFSKENFDLATVVEFPENDKVNKSNIIFGLDKHSKNLQNFYTNDTLDYISGETTDGPIDSIMNRSKEKMHEFLYPFLSGLESFKPFGTEFISNPAEALEKRLKGGEPEERKKILSLFYKQYMNIINYSVEKKKLLEEKLAKEEVMGKARINETPTEKEQDAIEDLLDNDKRKKGKLESFFKNHQLKDLPILCKEYGILANEVSGDTKELLQKLQEEKDDILDKDDDGQTSISRAETDIVDGSLERGTSKDLDKTCKNLLDVEFGDNSKSLFGAYTHLITDIFGDNKDLADSFMEKTGLKELAEEFKGNLEGYRARLEAGTFSAEDLKNLKSQTESYLNAKKQYEISRKNIDDMSDGLNINWLKILNLPIDAAKDIGKGLGQGKTNSRRERIGYGLGGCYVTGQTFYIRSKLTPSSSMLQKGVKIVTYGIGKTGIEIGKLPVTLAEKGLQLATGRTHLTSRSRLQYIKNNPHLADDEREALLKYAFFKGEISENGVLRTAKQLKLSSGNGSLLNINNLIQKRSGGQLDTTEKIETFKKYMKNKDLRKLLLNEKSNKGLSTKEKLSYSFKNKELKIDLEINNSNFSKLQLIEENIQKFGSGSKEKLFREAFMQDTKTLDHVDDFMKNKNLMSLLTEIGNTSTDEVKLSKILANNFHNFSSLDEIEKYMLFVKNNKSSIKNTNVFINNSIKKRSEISKMTAIEQTKYIESAKLNNPSLTNYIDGVKEKFKGSVESKTSFDDMTKSISESQKNVESKLSTTFAEFDKEVAEEAKKLNLTKGTPEYQKLANKIRESSRYGGDTVVKELIEQHNVLTKTTEKTILKQFNGSDWTTKQKLYSENPVIKRIIDANGGIKNRKLPGRTGRMISIGIHSVMLGRIGSSDDEKGNKKERKTIRGEAADFGLGMIPVAGGLYDMGMAFRGKDLNGREMGTAERWIRGGVGLGTGVLDVFTFGMGGTAVRGVLKGGTKIALKVGTKELASEGAKIASESVVKGFAKQTLKNAGRDILIGTTAGIALVPVINSFDKDKLD